MNFHLTDESPMPFGKYRGTKMSDVPASYLHWLWTQGGFQIDREPKKIAVCEYIKANRAALEKDYPDGIWTTHSEKLVQNDIRQNRRDSLHARKCATCKHFNGVQNGVCEAQVPYAKFGNPIPCIPPFSPGNTSGVRCPKYDVYTPQEIEAQDAENAVYSNNAALARQGIMDNVERMATETGKIHYKGKIDCPVCKSSLRYSISPENNYVHAACDNPDCVRFIE